MEGSDSERVTGTRQGRCRVGIVRGCCLRGCKTEINVHDQGCHAGRRRDHTHTPFDLVPHERPNLPMGDNLMDFEVWLNSKLGHDFGSNSNEMLAGDPILICEVGHVVGRNWEDSAKADMHTLGPECGPESNLLRGPKLMLGIGPTSESHLGNESSMSKEGLNSRPPHVNISDLPDESPGTIVAMPTMAPPLGFIWQFLASLWALVPVNINPSSEVNSLVMDSKEVERSEMQAGDLDSPYHSSESDDSMAEIEKNLRVLLPDLPVEKDASIAVQAKELEEVRD